MQSSAPWQKLRGGPYLELSYKNQKGMISLLGVRRKEDVEATLEYAKREWMKPVDASFNINSISRERNREC
jgi:hypothetical protein